MTFWQCFTIIDAWMILLVFYYGIYRQGGLSYYLNFGFREEMIHEVASILREERAPQLYGVLSTRLEKNVWTSVYTLFVRKSYEQVPVCTVFITFRTISVEFLEKNNFVLLKARAGDHSNITQILSSIRTNIVLYGVRKAS